MVTTLGLLLLGSSGTPPIESDSRLFKAHTLWERSIDLAQLVERASDLTGLKLTVAPTVQDERAILFVKDKPIGQTLAKLADCLELSWRSTKDGYELYRDKDAVAARREYAQSNLWQSEASLDAQLQTWRLAPFASAKDCRRMMQEAQDARRRLNQMSPPPADLQAQTDYFLERMKTLHALQPLAEMPVLALAKALTPADVVALKAGEWALGSARELPGFVKLPGVAADYDQREKPSGRPYTDVYVGLRFDPVSGQITYWGWCIGPDGSWLTGPTAPRSADSPARQAPKCRLAEDLSNWVSLESYDSLGERGLAGIVTPGPGTLV
jgi:hypothetical protein